MIQTVSRTTTTYYRFHVFSKCTTRLSGQNDQLFEDSLWQIQKHLLRDKLSWSYKNLIPDSEDPHELKISLIYPIFDHDGSDLQLDDDAIRESELVGIWYILERASSRYPPRNIAWCGRIQDHCCYEDERDDVQQAVHVCHCCNYDKTIAIVVTRRLPLL